MSLVRIDRLMRRNSAITVTAIGVAVCNDKKLVQRMRNGSTLQARTAAKLDQYLREQGV